MQLDEILRDIHALEVDLQNYERKYGVLSETFYEAYCRGEEPEDDAWVMDWSAWAGTYEIWMRRRDQYREIISRLKEKDLGRQGCPECPIPACHPLFVV